MIGNDGADALIGVAGSDTLVGNNGNNVYQFGAGAGSDIISDSGGSDLLQFTGVTTFGSLNFSQNVNDPVIDYAGQQIVVQTHYVAGSQIEQTNLGSASYAGCAFGASNFTIDLDQTGANGGSDLIVSTAAGQIMNGGGGPGRDLLFDNAGNDTITGRGADDLMGGGAGDDQLVYAAAGGDGRRD